MSDATMTGHGTASPNTLPATMRTARPEAHLPDQGRPSRGAIGRGAHSPYEALARALGVFSIGLGLAELLAPRAHTRAFGLEGMEGVIRAYGAREIATGVALLMTHDPTPYMWGRVAGDAMDLATLAPGFKGSNPKREALTVATLAVAGITVLDFVVAQGLTADKRLSKPGTWDFSDRTGFPRAPEAMRGTAADLDVPGDFRIPELLRPWRDGRPAVAA